MDVDERVDAFLSRPLEGAWPYLWLDAIYLKVREGGRIVSRAVIIAVAVNEDGKREVLGVATCPSEAFGFASPFWTDFLRSLADRGLRGVKLVIADDHKGLRAAARRRSACRGRCPDGALVQGPDGGTDQSAKDPQTTDVWPRQPEMIDAGTAAGRAY